MLVYSLENKPLVEIMRNDGWSNDLIEKYLSYVMKKQTMIESGRTSTRDSTRQKTYKAEWKFQQQFRGTIKEFSTEKQVAAYMKRVLKSKLWKDMTNDKRVTLAVKALGNRTAGRAYGSHIELNSKYGMDQYTLLHEMAHCAGHMHHDVSFRLCVLKLVSRFIGRDAAKALKACFKEQKLKMSVPKAYSDPTTWLENYRKMEKVRSKIKKAA